MGCVDSSSVGVGQDQGRSPLSCSSWCLRAIFPLVLFNRNIEFSKLSVRIPSRVVHTVREFGGESQQASLCAWEERFAL